MWAGLALQPRAGRAWGLALRPQPPAQCSSRGARDAGRAAPTPPAGPWVARYTHLAHLPVEVLLQACDALERVDVETHTAAGGGGTQNEHEGQGGQPGEAYTPPTPPSPGSPEGARDRRGTAVRPGKEARGRPPPHLFHRDGSSSCRSTFISSNTFCALMSSSSACRQDSHCFCRPSQPARPGQATLDPLSNLPPSRLRQSSGKGEWDGAAPPSQPPGPSARPCEALQGGGAAMAKGGPGGRRGGRRAQ